MNDATRRMAALEPEGKLPVRVAVERDAERLQILDAADSRTEPRPATTVSARCNSGLSSDPMAAARPP
jgi:hypothetical protein